MTMETGLRCTPVDQGEYTIIWKFMPVGWAKGLSLIESPGVMPYFIDGEAYGELQTKDVVELTPYALFCGVYLPGSRLRCFVWVIKRSCCMVFLKIFSRI